MATQDNKKVYLCNTYSTILPNQKNMINKFTKCMLFDNIEKAHKFNVNTAKTTGSYHQLIHSQIYHVSDSVPTVVENHFVTRTTPEPECF